MARGSTIRGKDQGMARLRRPWRDGTRAIRFEPAELLEKLAAMVPKPRVNLLLYHGAFAPHARSRPGAVWSAQEGAGRQEVPGACTQPESATTSGARSAAEAERSPPGAMPSLAGGTGSGAAEDAPLRARPPPPASYARPKHYAWAKLLERTFEIDVLACPDCGRRLRLLATIEDTPARGFRRAGPAVVERILRHLELPVDVPTPAPAPASRYLPGLEPSDLGRRLIRRPERSAPVGALRSGPDRGCGPADAWPWPLQPVCSRRIRSAGGLSRRWEASGRRQILRRFVKLGLYAA